MRNQQEILAWQKHNGFLVLCVVLVAMAAIACSGSDSGSDQRSVLSRGLSGDPESLDPHLYSSDQAAFILRDIGEGLLAYTPNGQLKPAVAESWSLSEDGLRYEFIIREEAKWSDGTSIRASDFVFAFRRLLNPNTASPSAALFLSIANSKRVLEGVMPEEELGVFAIDEKRLRIQLDSPTPYFLQLLAHPAMFPLHPLVGNQAESSASSVRYIANGAYKLDKWSVGSEVLLSRNAYYWDDVNTAFDSVRWIAVEGVEETNRFRAGQLDTTQNVASSLFSLVGKEHPDELRTAPTLGVYFYGFNLNDPIFGESVELRRALSLALDRTSITSQITRRGEEPAYSWVPPGIGNYVSPDTELSKMAKEQRERLARELYAEAGYSKENPLQFELRYNTSDLQETIAVAAQSMWRQVLGAQVTLVNEEFKVLLSNIRSAKETQLFRLSWTGDYNDPVAFLQLLGSDNPSNFMRYSSDEVDRLLGQASLTRDSMNRMRLLAKAEAKILDDQPVIPIYFYVSKHLVAEGLEGWEDNVLDVHYSKDLRPSAKK